MAAIIDELLMFLFGLYFTAVGYGWIAAPGGTEAARQALLTRSGKIFRVCGPVLIVVGIVLFFMERLLEN